MHIALKIIKKLFQNPPKIIKNLHQLTSKSILQRLLWAPLMRPLAPFGGGGTPGVPKSAQDSKTSGKSDLLDPPLGDPFWDSKLQEKSNLI